MHLTTMQMLQYKDMTNMVTYNVYSHHVMIYHSMDVSMQMALEPSTTGLELMHVLLTVEHLVKSLL